MVQSQDPPPDQGTVPPISMSALALNTSQIQAIDFQCLISTVGSFGGRSGDYEQRGIVIRGRVQLRQTSCQPADTMGTQSASLIVFDLC